VVWYVSAGALVNFLEVDLRQAMLDPHLPVDQPSALDSTTSHPTSDTVFYQPLQAPV
jgi:hypothetical protein